MHRILEPLINPIVLIWLIHASLAEMCILRMSISGFGILELVFLGYN